MNVNSVYRYVIDDVIRNVKAEFVNEGVEDIIGEFQSMWEARLMQSGAVAPVEPERTEEEQQLQQLQTNPTPVNNSDISEQTARSALNTLRQMNTPQSQSQFGKPSQFMPIKDIVNNNNNSSNNGNTTTLPPLIASTSASLRSIMNPIPQNDGSTDDSKEYIDNLILEKLKEKQNQPIEFQMEITGGKQIPQLDGNEDEDEDEFEDEPLSKDADDDLNSDLDDDDDDPDPIIEHFVLCQYEKVSRIKNKRKCNFKDGVMHLNGRDSLFHKANGEFIWS
eukprot:gene845-1052_t